MIRYIMRVILKPDHQKMSVLETIRYGPAMTGNGEDNYLCGACQFVLCKNVRSAQVIGIVIRCPRCKAYNVRQD